MKIFKKIILLVVVVIGTAIVMTGCGDKAIKISKPSVAIVESNERLILMTTDNPNASEYIFGIYTGSNKNDLELYLKQTTENYFLDVTDFINESAIYYFYVQVLGDGENYLDSDVSTIVSYDDNVNALTAPTLEESNEVLIWNKIVNATGYKVYKNNVLIVTLNGADSTSYDISEHIRSKIEYTFEVQAIGGTSLGVTYENSLKSNKITYTEHLVLATPENLQIVEDELLEEESLIWDAVAYAKGYSVLIDNSIEITTQTNALPLKDVLTLAKQYSLKVKALGDDVLIDGEYSEAIIYDNYLKLDTPSIISAKRNGIDVSVKWTEIENAQSYTLLVNGQTLKDVNENTLVIYDTEVLVPGELEKEEGGFDFEVYVNAYGYYLESDTSELYYYLGIDELSAPENLTVSYNSEDGTVLASWEEVEQASAYVLAIDDLTISTEEPFFNIENLLVLDEIYSVRVKAIGTNFVLSSDFSEEYIYNYREFEVEDYTDRYFYYYGYKDYFITSQEEMNDLFAYAITSKLDAPFDAYVYYNLTSEQEQEADKNGNGSVTMEEKIIYQQEKAIEAYTSTYQVSYEEPTNAGPIYEYTFNLEFNQEVVPNLTSNQTNITQDERITPYASQVGRSEDYNDFVSEQSLVEVEVENSDQLVMVITSGVKPVFADNVNGVATEALYNSAKDVLRTIIDDGMTDYQKMLAIFDYVTYNTVYDYEVLNIALNNPSSSNLLNYKVFYAEGVLLDGKAVCDGIAKTIALLGNMEGIETIKIDGEILMDDDAVGHAWNKVNLNIDGVTNWYVIDATWNDLLNNNAEYLTHRYFLMTDADIENTHLATSNYNPVANTAFDYYNYQTYEAGKDYYIEDQNEFDAVIDYMIQNTIEGMEFKVADDFDSPYINLPFFAHNVEVDQAFFTQDGNYIVTLNYN